ncbi:MULTISPECIES: response regulator [Pseudoalteromonas]|uniref:HoxA-like transcriptional regulator n=1 Tax=Pseudoalteromonas luteoviolacea (strain 2ta16) TaxID=1353533 RepID=V4HSE3_PSEL2|nr:MULTISPECIES: response regulator [Pseudoalteromonas]ESP93755.1 HoxA-like transcriptional regulator [Pseudoalteromonas luteoviolacea 2ta16]MCG7550796.1 response regulator [Pseudoalteromonas sp. Of7M-16]
MKQLAGKVMIVEDDLEYLNLYREVLNTHFDVHFFTCARDALGAVNTLNPQAIILDLHLPDISGIELCNELNQQKRELTDVEIIFVSGETDIAQKLKAYELGAADFLGKPFEIEDLKHKIASSIQRHITKQKLREEPLKNTYSPNHYNTQAPLCNQIMHFYNYLSGCTNPQNIADAFFSLMSNFGLQTSICFRLPNVKCLRDDHIRPTPIEEEIFEILRHTGQIHEFANRMLVNEEQVSFLIKNIECESLSFKEIKHSVSDIAQAMNAKIIALSALGEKTPISCDLSRNLDELCFNISDYQIDTNRLLTIMTYKITEHLQSLNIPNEENLRLNELIQNTIQEIDAASENLLVTTSKLSELLKYSK